MEDDPVDGDLHGVIQLALSQTGISRGEVLGQQLALDEVEDNIGSAHRWEPGVCFQF